MRNNYVFSSASASEISAGVEGEDEEEFYDEYDDKIKEGSVTEEERRLFKEAVKDLNAMVEKNSENIKLIARELTDS